MRFPKESLILFALRADFVDLEELLHFSKKHRSYKRSFYITIDYPDSFDIILVKQGELSKILRLGPNASQATDILIKDVYDKVKHTDSSHVNAGFVDDQLLAMIASGLNNENLIREVDCRSMPPANLLRDLAVQHFSGILVATRRNEKSYALLNEGEISLVYLVGGGRTRDDFVRYVNEIAAELKIKILKYVPEEATYATTAQIDLLMTSSNRLLEEFSAILGRNIVKKIAEISLKGVAKDYPLFNDFQLSDEAKLSGEPKVDTESLVKGFAGFFNMLAESLSTISGGRHITVFRKALQDYRFALNNLKFFENIKEQIF